MSFRSIGGNEWRDMGTTGQGRSGPAETKGFPTMHSGSMYGKVEHESGYGRRSGFGGSGMGHIGGGGIDGYSQQAVTRRPVRQRASSTQDPDINISPLMKRSDSFSSFTGQQTGSSKANLGAKSGSSNIVCKREAFYVVEDRPVIIARTQFIREHRLYEVEFVKETYFNSERELISDQAEEIVEQKERIVSVTPKDPCGCVTGNEYGIQGFSGLPRSRRGSGRQEMF